MVIGNGGREHAIVWKLSHSDSVTELLVSPGNAGTQQIAQNVPIPSGDVAGLLDYAKQNKVDLTVVGPEAPMVAGISNAFSKAGLLVVGPTKEAALLESSKSFAKNLMLDIGIPTGSAEIFTSYNEARDYVISLHGPVVVKADGLAAGKGVIVTQTENEALEALSIIMKTKRFGTAGDKVLIEEYLEGQEISVFAFVDGRNISSMVSACDYKRIGDGDVGPNTGGMGSFSPPMTWTQELENQVRVEIMEPVVQALKDQGTPYTGILYAGLILTTHGPKVLEFNCRLGDPETQVILPRLKTDFADVMFGLAQGRLDEFSVEWKEETCVGIVLASEGYPSSYSTGCQIHGLDDLDSDIPVFHAGTKLIEADNGNTSMIVTDGGRVLTVSALGKTIDEARYEAYKNIKHIEFEGMVYRKDIAKVNTKSKNP